MSQPRLDAHNWFLLVVLSIVWGGSFLFARIAVQEIPPMTLVFARVALAALTLNLFLLLKKNSFVHTRAMWVNFAGMGILNNIIPFGLIFYGQLEIGAGLAAIINAMTPIWTVLIAHFATGDEKLSKNKVAGVLLGFIGVAILIGSSALSGLFGSTLGQVAVLGATISYGFASVFGKRFAMVPPLETARGQLTASTVIMAPLALVIDMPWQLAIPSQAAIWSVLGLAIICTAFAYVLFFRILANAGAVNVSLVTLLVPISAIALGAVFLSEVLETRQFVGMGLILAGLIANDGRIFKRWSQK